MKKFFKKLLLLIFLTIVFCGLNESFSTKTIFIGFILSFITIFVLKNYLPNFSSNFSYTISPFKALKYLIILFINIYASSFKTIKSIFSKDAHTNFVTTTTTVKKPWFRVIIGNSITLTPGTVTIDLNKNKYTILCLNSNQYKDSHDILSDFEKTLK